MMSSAKTKCKLLIKRGAIMEGGFYTATKGRIYPPPTHTFAKCKVAEFCFELIGLFLWCLQNVLSKFALF